MSNTSTSWMTITPRIAASMLEKSAESETKNRRVRAAAISRYANDMREGRWQENGQPILLNCDGAILDGQHRIHAIIQSGTSQRFVIVKGLDPSVMRTIDTGISRKATDVLSMHGIKNANYMAAAANLLFMWLNRMNFTTSGSTKLSPTAILSFLEDHPEVMASSDATSPNTIKAFISPTGPMFLWCAVDPKHRAKAQEFIHAVQSGEDLKRDNPAFVFRRAIIQTNGSKKFQRVVILAMLVKMWNLFAQGKPASIAAFRSNEAFPEIVLCRSDRVEERK